MRNRITLLILFILIGTQETFEAIGRQISMIFIGIFYVFDSTLI